MLKKDIRVGAQYRAKVSGNVVTVKVLHITDGEDWRGKAQTRYTVQNLKTGRKAVFRSAAKFRNEVGMEPPRAPKKLQEAASAAVSAILNPEPLPATTASAVSIAVTNAEKTAIANQSARIARRKLLIDGRQQGKFLEAEYAAEIDRLSQEIELNKGAGKGYRGDNLYYYDEEADPLRPETPPPAEFLGCTTPEQDERLLASINALGILPPEETPETGRQGVQTAATGENPNSAPQSGDAPVLASETPNAGEDDMRFIRWAHQAADEASARIARVETREGARTAFAEGYRQGYLKAVADLKMHGLLK